MGIQVVRLEVWCDFVDLVGPQLTFRISEFAVLADGRRVLLHDQRGFTTSTHRSGAQAADRPLVPSHPGGA